MISKSCMTKSCWIRLIYFCDIESIEKLININSTFKDYLMVVLNQRKDLIECENCGKIVSKSNSSWGWTSFEDDYMLCKHCAECETCIGCGYMNGGSLCSGCRSEGP